MREAVLVAFNLLLNGVGSFAMGTLVALAASRVLRASAGRAQVWLWSLPFAKLVFDAAHGIPDRSFLWLRARGFTQDLGSFGVGVGIERVVPRFDLRLGALLDGVRYSQSAADLLASGLLEHIGLAAPAAIVAILIVGISVRLARRAVALARAAQERRRMLADPPQEVRVAGRRRVPIHIVGDLDGSAFTGGVLRPFVAFPAHLWDALSPVEREAAIQHELCHIAELHVPWMVLAGFVSDVFWFVPWIDRARARLAAACELAADALATRRGADPLALASALVRTRELGHHAGEAACAFGASGASLASRVARLLATDAAAPRAPRLRALAHAAFVLWAAAIVAIAVPFGNH